MAKAIVNVEAKKGVIKDLKPEGWYTWLRLRGQFSMSSEDMMDYVPDKVYDEECDKRYNPMAKKAKGGRKKGRSVALHDKIKGNKESLFSLTSETFINHPAAKKTGKLVVEWTEVDKDKLATTETHAQKMGSTFRRPTHLAWGARGEGVVEKTRLDLR